jgi:hypothetical protein
VLRQQPRPRRISARRQSRSRQQQPRLHARSRCVGGCCRARAAVWVLAPRYHPGHLPPHPVLCCVLLACLPAQEEARAKAEAAAKAREEEKRKAEASRAATQKIAAQKAATQKIAAQKAGTQKAGPGTQRVGTQPVKGGTSTTQKVSEARAVPGRRNGFHAGLASKTTAVGATASSTSDACCTAAPNPACVCVHRCPAAAAPAAAAARLAAAVWWASPPVAASRAGEAAEGGAEAEQEARAVAVRWQAQHRELLAVGHHNHYDGAGLRCAGALVAARWVCRAGLHAPSHELCCAF